jgi:hypothetical protein
VARNDYTDEYFNTRLLHTFLPEEIIMIHWKRVIYPLLGISMCISGVSACSAPQGDVDAGKRWYMMHNCYSCHGLNGNDGKGPVIDADKISFRSFLSSVRNAGSPVMPRFPEEKVSKQDAADMYTWLRTK